MRRVLTVVMCIVFVAGMFSGCVTASPAASPATSSAAAAASPSAAGTAPALSVSDYMNATGLPIAKDKLVYKALGSMNVSVQGPFGDMKVIKKMADMTNISFDWNTPESAAYMEQKNLILASGSFPDILMGNALTISDEETYGAQQKALIPLDDLIAKYMPNLQKRLLEKPYIRNAITASDGHIYSLPYIVSTPTVAGYILYINMDWLSRVGVPKPTNVDELYTALKAFKEKDPNQNGQADEIPMSSYAAGSYDSYGNECVMTIYDQTILNAFSGQAGGAYFDVKDGKVVYNPIQPFYKEYLTYMNRLYKEGLIDNEMFTQKSENMFAKGKAGQVGVSTASLSMMCDPAKHDNYELLPPLTSSFSDKKVTPQWPGVITGAFAITKACKYPEAIARWVDMLYATLDENIEGICGLAMFLGINNEDFSFTDSTRTKYVQKSGDPNLTPTAYIGKYVTPGAASGFPCWVVTDAVPDGNPLLLIKATESQKQFFPYQIPTYPNTVRLSKEDSQRATFLIKDINTYVNQMTAKFVVGEEPISNFDSYVDNLKKMSLDELTQIEQKGYDQWASAGK